MTDRLHSGEIGAFIDAIEQKAAGASAVADEDDEQDDGILSSFRDAANTVSLAVFSILVYGLQGNYSTPLLGPLRRRACPKNSLRRTMFAKLYH